MISTYLLHIVRLSAAFTVDVDKILEIEIVNKNNKYNNILFIKDFTLLQDFNQLKLTLKKSQGVHLVNTFIDFTGIF